MARPALPMAMLLLVAAASVSLTSWGVAASDSPGHPPCAAGNYSNAANTSCLPCPAGTSSTVVGAHNVSTCVPCPAGHYSRRSATACIQCSNSTTPPGRFCPEASGPAGSICPAGYFCPGGSADKQPCPAYYYSDLTNQTSNASCILCANGKYSLPAAQICTTKCPPGRYLGEGSTICASCSPGSFSSGSSFTCSLCPPGKYSGAQATTCIPCESGTYSGTSGATTCSGECAAGTFSAATGATSMDTCQPCLPGTYSSTKRSPGCNSCPAGSYAGAGASTCTLCRAGTIGHKSALSECSACAAGKFSEKGSELGSTACLDCVAGTYSDGFMPCLPGPSCPNGTSPGSSICWRCPIGTYTIKRGGTSMAVCDKCPQGKYGSVSGADDFDLCLLCPAGKFAGVGSSDCVPSRIIVVGAGSRRREVRVMTIEGREFEIFPIPAIYKPEIYRRRGEGGVNEVEF